MTRLQGPAYVQRLAKPHHQPFSTVRCCVVLHSSGPKGKWSSPLSAHSYSFHPTVLLEKALSTALGPAVSGSGVRADLLRGRRAPIQSVIKHTAHLTDPAPPSVPSHSLNLPLLPEIKHRAAVPLALLSAWVSHHINTQGRTVNTASLVLLVLQCVYVCLFVPACVHICIASKSLHDCAKVHKAVPINTYQSKQYLSLHAP